MVHYYSRVQYYILIKAFVSTIRGRSTIWEQYYSRIYGICGEVQRTRHSSVPRFAYIRAHGPHRRSQLLILFIFLINISRRTGNTIAVSGYRRINF